MKHLKFVLVVSVVLFFASSGFAGHTAGGGSTVATSGLSVAGEVGEKPTEPQARTSVTLWGDYAPLFILLLTVAFSGVPVR